MVSSINRRLVVATGRWQYQLKAGVKRERIRLFGNRLWTPFAWEERSAPEKQ